MALGVPCNNIHVLLYTGTEYHYCIPNTSTVYQIPDPGGPVLCNGPWYCIRHMYSNCTINDIVQYMSTAAQ